MPEAHTQQKLAQVTPPPPPLGSTQRSNVGRVRSSRQNVLKFSKIFTFKPKVKTVTGKLSFKLRIWPGNLVMDILKYSQHVIFSHCTIFITFSYRCLAGSYEVRGGKNRKWRRIFAFDRCVPGVILDKRNWKSKLKIVYKPLPALKRRKKGGLVKKIS